MNITVEKTVDYGKTLDDMRKKINGDGKNGIRYKAEMDGEHIKIEAEGL